MLETINNWGEYRSRVREFDAVLEHGKAALAALGSVEPDSARIHYGAQIYAKLVAHAAALRRLAADPAEAGVGTLWDMPSMCAIAHCAVEAHDVFDYVAGHDVGDEERSFRVLLWAVHDATRRVKALDAAMGATDERINGIRADAERLKGDLEAHAFLATLPAELQQELRRRLAAGQPPAFHLGLKQRCASSGVDADWHAAVTRQLQHYVHTLPFTTHQLAHLSLDSAEAIRLVALPLFATLPFLARVIDALTLALPGRLPMPPSRTGRTMQAWRQVARTGRLE
jgi:hypothetical protein